MPGARILLVEDHRDTQQLYSAYLELAGFDVTAVSSATEGLRHLAVNRFDAISTDLAMPGMDGAEFVRRIRKSIQPALPILVITGQARNLAITQQELDCCGVLLKPCDLEHVVELLRVLVRECPQGCNVCRHLAAGDSTQ